MKTEVIVTTAVLALAGSAARAQTPVGTAFTYQGRLTDGGTPPTGSYDLELRLFTAASAGTQVGGTVSVPAVPVSAGLFTVSLDFGSAAFGPDARWLQVAVRPAGGGAYTTLGPRQRLTPAPAAVFSSTAPWTGLTGMPPGFADSVDNDILAGLSCGSGQVAKWNGSGWACAADNDTVGWGLTGNAGTNPATNFIGTTGDTPLEVRVNSQRVGRFEPAFGLPNVVLGDRGNSVLTGAYAATVAGGGWSSLFGVGDGDNIVTGNGGTVSGGIGNQAGDNDGNPGSTLYATVGGGFYNEATGDLSTIAGGHINTAPGARSAVPGGYHNQAGGAMSLATGNSARIRTAAESGTPDGDFGTFVWADSPSGANSGVDFTSTGANQFLVRAGGGVGINTNAPGFNLEVASGTDTQVAIRSVTSGGRVWSLQSSNGTAAGTLSGSFQIVDRTASASRLLITSAGLVGINTVDPLGFTLAVNGSAAKPGGGSWSTFSDARLKRDVQPLEGALDQLLALRGVRFEYLDPEAIHELPGQRIGMVAQEVAQVFPDWVTEGPDGYLLLTVRGFEALTVEALRDLRREKDAQIEALQSALDAQARRIAALEEAMAGRAKD